MVVSDTASKSSKPKPSNINQLAFLSCLLPLGIASKLVSNKDDMGGSLVKLYKSVENLSDTYIQPATNKDEVLLKPTTLSAGANVLWILTNDDPKARRTVLLCDQLLV
ncbi:unnamed protein product [Prunus brigantina]